MFHKFYNRVTIEADMEAVTAVHIGAGQESFQPSSVSASLLKNSNGQPYVPGSSIKGVLRSFLESLPIHAKACYMGEGCAKAYDTGEKRERLRVQLREMKCEDEYYSAAQEIAARACLACRLFGSKVLAGKISISDAVIESDAPIKTEIRRGNAIDRDTHTAKGTALFSIEVIPSGSVFRLVIEAENLTEKETEIFSSIIQYFADGNLKIGGIRRGGLGKVKLNIKTITVMKRDAGNFPKSEPVPRREDGTYTIELHSSLDGSYAEEPREVLNVPKISK